MRQVGRVRNILGRWRNAQSKGVSEEPELERRTHPEARMSLMLRFATEAGPRTVVASGVPLGLAADIAREMEKAGHFAQFVDQLPLMPMAERIKRLKSEKQQGSKRRPPNLALVRARAVARRVTVEN